MALLWSTSGPQDHFKAREVHRLRGRRDGRGTMRHETTMDVEANYTDSRGQSEIGIGITRLLNFDLLPRIKRIKSSERA
ncbi:transposase [Streptomyces sp. MST-110588]|uniref:transposase n=1 Tax=Streptomyces sp. MST-110588 TaxID=2833628 RepID=UPI001F5D8976|nr:transposase [Streptomyces sp. MST-110588]UNO43438.1 Tn3 family transposase [Streptomyces sp. MST-110588]